MQSMKGELLSHRTCLLSGQKSVSYSVSHFAPSAFRETTEPGGFMLRHNSAVTVYIHVCPGLQKGCG